MKYAYTTDATARFLPEEVGEFLVHRTRVTIVPKGEPTFSERATEIEIVDDAGGEWVKLRQSAEDLQQGEVGIDPDAWPVMRLVIDAMVSRCRVEREEEND